MNKVNLLYRAINNGRGLWLLLAITLLLTACSSVKMPSLPSLSVEDDKDYPIYNVMTERTPFYKDHKPKAGKTYPYLYLSKGMTVTLLKNGNPYSQVSLINGMRGWMPIAKLAPQMISGEGDALVSPASTAGNTGANRAAGRGPKPPLGPVPLPSYNQ